MTVADAAQRQRALDPRRSFAVAAPAGSGKTELLTQRVLGLLATVGAPEEILCMTFTRKAAGEMRHRIIQALTLADNPSRPESDHQATTLQLAAAALARDREKNWQLLQSPNRLRIQTIDGFCLNLAQQLGPESGIGDYAEPLEDPEPHFRLVIAKWLLRELEQQTPQGQAVETLLQHLDNDLNKLEQLLIALLKKREQWLSHMFFARNARDYLESFLNNVIEETLEAAATLLAPFASEVALLADYAGSHLPPDKNDQPIRWCKGITALPGHNAEDMPIWLGICELLLTKEPKWRSRLDKNTGFPTEVNGDKILAKQQKASHAQLVDQLQTIGGLKELLEDIRALPEPLYEENQWLALNALTYVLPTLTATLSLHFQQHRVCDFTEITLAALGALGPEEEPTDLALRLDYQIKHILTDEFQDTSSVQFEILRRLIAGWEQNDGRTLFIVGDAMQSLYNFRNANVGLFLEARTLPIGQLQLEALDLQVNFRSQENLIRWVNDTFPGIFPARDEIGRGAVSYNPAIAFRGVLPEQPVTLDAFINAPDNGPEALRIVALVDAAKKRNPQGSIGILVRSRNHLPDILAALREAGHHWQATDIDPLGNRMPVVDLMSLTRALLSPADRIAWLALLRAPWCGLDMADLLTFSTAKAVSTDDEGMQARFPLLLSQMNCITDIPGLSSTGRQILQRVSKTLMAAWQQRQRLPLRCWVEGTWRALGGEAALNAITDQQHCNQYFDLLEKHETAGCIEHWPTFEKAVKSLYAEADAGADSNLHVMTIHKAKGLEFDTVILPGLNRKSRGEDRQLLLWQERTGINGENQLLISPLSRTDQQSDPLYQFLDRERKLKTRLETARVLYVATTRAVGHLHLLCTMSEDKPAAGSLLESLWPALKTDIENRSTWIQWHDYPLVNSKPVIAHEAVLSSLRRLPADWEKPPTAGTGKTTPPTVVTQALTLAELDTASPTPEARHTGTVLHRILRQMVIDGIDQWSTSTIRQRMPFWNIQLRQLGLCDTTSPLAVLERAVENCLSDPTARWILDNRHPDSATELAIDYIAANGEPKTAVIDRSFVDQEIRWIIDYKTASPRTGQTTQQFLAQQVAQYREQLQRYARLFEDPGAIPVQKALYFPLLQTIELIP
ncbi:UvrD-helicase domain-containing protein [Porticoccus sp.]|uniref:UvrD-helicase domain-containing protein n=1 Tax=Porticoccus sp. TaxID=2024853 RepID=UPI003F6A49B8